LLQIDPFVEIQASLPRGNAALETTPAGAVLLA